jgi:rare lipoprotein A
LFAVWLTVVALPILVIDNIPRTEARAAQVSAMGHVAPESSTVASTVPSTTGAPTTEAPTTSAAPAGTTDGSVATTAPTRPKAATVRVVESTTTTAAPTTTAPSNEQTGGASWYDYNPGECAHRTLPKGTVVTVTRLDTGASVTCTITDRGPYDGGRILDMDRSTFAQLADPGTGVIQVRITW